VAVGCLPRRVLWAGPPNGSSLGRILCRACWSAGGLWHPVSPSRWSRRARMPVEVRVSSAT
jgi:hypothetical protein